MNAQFCWGTQTFLRANAKFCGGTQMSLRENAKFHWKLFFVSGVSERKVLWGNKQFLWANARFHGECKCFCERMQSFSFCGRTQSFMGERKSFCKRVCIKIIIWMYLHYSSFFWSVVNKSLYRENRYVGLKVFIMNQRKWGNQHVLAQTV